MGEHKANMYTFRMMLGYESHNHVVYSSKYQVVWCPKYRRKVLAGGVEKRLLELIHEAAARYRAEVIGWEIRPDHVHLFVEVDPQLGIHRLFKNIKGVTSHELRKAFDSLRTSLPSLWTNSYFCSTVGGAPLEVTKQYVENQKNV